MQRQRVILSSLTLFNLLLLLAIGVSSASLSAQEVNTHLDVNQIVKNAFSHDIDNIRKLRDYIYQEEVQTEYFDGDGKVKKKEVIVTEHFIVDGMRYQRVLVKDGKPLPERERAEQETHLDGLIQRRRTQSEDERAKQEKQLKEKEEEAIKLREDIVNGFAFKLLGTEEVDGRACWKIEAEPKSDFKGKSHFAPLFQRLSGTLWVNQTSGVWQRLEASPVTKIGRGPIAISADSAFHITQSPVNGEFWYPHQIDIRLNARFLFLHKNIRAIGILSNFQKYRVETKVMTGSAEASSPD